MYYFKVIIKIIQKMPRSENARQTTPKHDRKKILSYVQNGGMLGMVLQWIKFALDFIF